MRNHTQGQLIAMKKRLLDKLINKEMTRKQVAGLLSIHPGSVSRLKKNYIDYGEEVLIPEPPGPKKGSITHNRTPKWIEDIIIKLATDNLDKGPIDLAQLFYDDYNINIDQTTVWRILKRRKIRYSLEHKRWKKEPPKAYCLDTPGLELQMLATPLVGLEK